MVVRAAERRRSFPTLYASMSSEEIKDVLALADKAKARKVGLWKYASSALKGFNAKLLFAKNGAFDAAKDPGPVIMPKQFRRLSTYSVEKKSKVANGTRGAMGPRTVTPA